MIPRYPPMLSPKQRIPYGYDCWHMIRIYRSRRFLVIWSLMMAIPVAACLVRIWLQPPNSIIGFLPVIGISGGAAAAVISCLMTGEIDTNFGIFLRTSEPFRFWLALSMGMICYIAPVVFVSPNQSRVTPKAEQHTDGRNVSSISLSVVRSCG